MATKTYFDKLEKKYGRLTIGGAIKAWRECDEQSQTAFAKRLGISVKNLNDIEKERKIPSPASAAKIARRLGFFEDVFIQLALRDILYKDGFKYNVFLKSA